MSKYMSDLIYRDIRKILSLRTIIIWFILSLSAIFFFKATGGMTYLIQSGRIQFMSVFLPQVIFGAWAVMAAYFDTFASDRDSNVLDCILCSGVTIKCIFTSKVIAVMLASMLLSLIYLVPVGIMITVVSEKAETGLSLIRYVMPLWGTIMAYAAIGIMISIAARSSKSALVSSMALGLILMPRFFIMIIDGIGEFLNWTQNVKDTVGLFSPGIMLETLSGYAPTAGYIKILIGFTVSIICIIYAAFIVFCRQDEYSYGK